jgi:predicted transcriptional regulator
MTTSTQKRAGQTNAGFTTRATKKDQLIKLLGAKAGADIKSLSEKLGWQQHTTRAAITGLRKAGYEVATDKPARGGLSKYRILSVPKVQEVGAALSAADGA